MPSLSLVLLLSIVLGSAAKIESQEATNQTRCKWYGVFPKVSGAPVLVRGSSTDNADIDEHIVLFKMTTTGNLCDFLRSFVAFSCTSHRKMAANINDTEYNTLPVLYNINSSAVI